MIKFPRTILYAIQAIVELTTEAPGTPISSHKLAARGKMPERFLVQILGHLVSGGVLRSVQGVAGGYYLARNAESITLLDIWDSLDTADRTLIPQMEGLTPELRQCLTHAADQIWAAAQSELSKLTIADLCDKHSHCAAASS